MQIVDRAPLCLRAWDMNMGLSPLYITEVFVLELQVGFSQNWITALCQDKTFTSV